MQRVQCSVISNSDSVNYYQHTAILASVLKEIYHTDVFRKGQFYKMLAILHALLLCLIHAHRSFDSPICRETLYLIISFLY